MKLPFPVMILPLVALLNGRSAARVREMSLEDTAREILDGLNEASRGCRHTADALDQGAAAPRGAP